MSPAFELYLSGDAPADTPSRDSAVTCFILTNYNQQISKIVSINKFHSPEIC